MSTREALARTNIETNTSCCLATSSTITAGSVISRRSDRASKGPCSLDSSRYLNIVFELPSLGIAFAGLIQMLQLIRDT